MALSRLRILQLLVLTTFALAVPPPAIKKGCAKSAIRSRSALPPTLKSKKVHLVATTNELTKGLKRSAEDEDCLEKKNKTPTIVQSAASAVPGSKRTEVLNNNLKSKKSEERKLDKSLTKVSESNIKTKQNIIPDRKTQVASSALSHIVKDTQGVKRTVPKKPNLKTLKNSPLWSLSKLIDDVSAITAKRAKQIDEISAITETKLKKNDTFEIKETSNDYHPLLEPDRLPDKHKTGTTKTTVGGLDMKEGLKATLSKAIEKVEKVVANKNKNIEAKKAASEKNTTVEAPKTNKTVDGDKKTAPGNTTAETTVNKGGSKKPAPDPYAEIAAGPDRPKLPELKSDDSTAASDSPLMKMNGGGSVEQLNDPASTMKNAKPLTGQHDVGGLLDSLTDKLNAAGGGVATDAPPIGGNEVKYLQSQLGLDDDAEKQPQDRGMQGMAGLDKLKEEADINEARKIAEENSAPSPSVPAPAGASPVDEGLDKDIMDKLASSEEGYSKTITDKANSLSKMGAMDILKGAKGGSDDLGDYADADISPGPDPYALPNSERGGNVPIGTEFGAHEMEASELLNGAGSLSTLPNQEGLERGVSEGYAQSDPATFEQAEENEQSHSFEQGEELTGNTRSRTKSEESYLNAAMGAMGVEGGYNTRQNIPDTLWNGARGLDSSDSFSNSYNTQMFKKNVILRPKRDKYVSPFTGKESFENDA